MSTSTAHLWDMRTVRVSLAQPVCPSRLQGLVYCFVSPAGASFFGGDEQKSGHSELGVSGRRIQCCAVRRNPSTSETCNAEGTSERGMVSRERSAEKKDGRSEAMKEKWRDPAWRAATLAARRRPEAVKRMSEGARNAWKNPEFREQMKAARKGRRAWNKGVSPSDVTRLRMSLARKGVKKSDETKRRISESKLSNPDESWKRLISEAKLGKSKEFFAWRREYRALRADLRLWSDSYRSKHRRLPRESSFEAHGLAPMLVLKVRRYIELSRCLPEDERESAPGKEILVFDEPGQDCCMH